jgi:hypothetical protein
VEPKGSAFWGRGVGYFGKGGAKGECFILGKVCGLFSFISSAWSFISSAWSFISST